MSNSKSQRVPGWDQRPRKRGKAFGGKFPIKRAIPMSPEMAGFVQRQAENANISTNEFMRECISLTAWNVFGEDIE